MAEEKKEQLKIEAQLDTSKLKQQAQQGMQSVVNEEKKVEQQSKQTSRAVDEIGQKGKNVGNALQQAGNAGSQAIRQIGQEADKTAKKIDEIAKATKNIGLKQGIGMVGGAIHQLAPVGQAIGSAMGMSDSNMSVAGGALTGATSGAMMGSAFGPLGAGIGAAAGALVGAGTALIEAAKMQKDAARDLVAASGRAAGATISRHNDIEYREETQRRVQGYLDNPETKGKLQNEIASLMSDIAEMRNQRNSIAEDITTVSQWSAEGLTGSKRVEFDTERSRKINELTDAYDENEKEIARFEERLKALQAVFNQLNNAAKEHKLDWFNDFASQAAKDYFGDTEKWQKELKEQQAKQKAFDSYTIEQKRENISNLQETQLKPLESMMNGMASFRLTDSLTRIGGGAGYGVQMQGISRYVSSISNNIQTIKGIIQQELDAIRELSNKYKPYYGEFMAQQDN